MSATVRSLISCSTSAFVLERRRRPNILTSEEQVAHTAIWKAIREYSLLLTPAGNKSVCEFCCISDGVAAETHFVVHTCTTGTAVARLICAMVVHVCRYLVNGYGLIN